MSIRAVPELRALEAGLEMFSKEVRARLTCEFSNDDGQRLAHAMAFAINACYATANSPDARRLAGQHGAIVDFDALVAARTPERRRTFSAAWNKDSPSPPFEAIVTDHYGTAQPMLTAAARLIKSLAASGASPA